MSSTITVPIFPLDGVLLTPGFSIHLYVFEPRYQQMLTWALEHDRKIIMAAPQPGHSTSEEHQPPVHPIGGLGEVNAHHQHANGHSDIELTGISRIEIVSELPQAWDFRLVEALPLPEDLSDPEAIARGMEPILGFLHGLDPSLPEKLEGMSPQQIVDIALMRLPVEPAVRLQIYSEVSVAKRLRMIQAILNETRADRPGLEFDADDPRRN